MVNPENVIDVTRLIQLAVAPVFLLTAVGTIIGVLSNRLGRAVDRSRTLEDRLRQLQPEGQKAARAELNLLSRRVRLVYGSIRSEERRVGEGGGCRDGRGTVTRA